MYMSREDRPGATSRKSRNVVRPSLSRTSIKPPPPRFPALGPTTARAKPTATAASTAFPPFLRISTPAAEDRGSSEATMALAPRTACAGQAARGVAGFGAFRSLPVWLREAAGQHQAAQIRIASAVIFERIGNN